MMRILAILAVLFISIPAAHALIADPLQIEHPYAYATTSVQKNGAVFMTIRYNGGDDLTLTKAVSDVAERVELHTHIMDGDMMMMRQVDHYEVPGNGTLTLEPTGNHIMLFGIKKPLTPNSQFPMTLHFSNGRTTDIMVNVVKPGDAP